MDYFKKYIYIQQAHITFTLYIYTTYPWWALIPKKGLPTQIHKTITKKVTQRTHFHS